MFALAVATLWLLQISVFSALITTFALAIIMQTGRALIAKSGLGDVGLGVGFVGGVGIFVFSGQALIIAGIPAYVAHWSVLAAMVAVAALISLQKTTADLTDNPSVGAEALFALSIALIVLSMRHPWVFPFAIPVAVFERYRHQMQYQVVLRLVNVSLIPAGWLVASALRPDRWWYYYAGNDSQFFEAIGWSIAHWGIFEHPGFAGGSIASYHWLVYALSGTLSHIGMLAPWDALIKIGPLFLIFILVGPLSGVIARHRPGPFTFRWMILTISLVLMPTFPMNSFGFSIVVGISFLLLATKSANNREYFAGIPVNFLLSFTLIFAKVSTAIVVAVILAIMLLLQRTRREKVNWLPAACLTVSLAMTWSVLFRGSVAGNSVFSFSPSFWKTVDRVCWALASPSVGWLVMLTLLLPLLGLLKVREIPSLSGAIVLVGSPALLFSILQATSTSYYFGYPCIFFTIGIIARKVNQHPPTIASENGALTRVLGIAMALLGIVIGVFYEKTLINVVRPDLQAESTHVGGFAWRILRDSSHFYFGFILLLAALWSSKKTRSATVVVSVALILGLSSGKYLYEFQQKSRQGVDSFSEQLTDSEPSFGSAGLIATSSYIRFNTDEQLILASNHFVSSGNYLLSAETRRRFLIQGLRFQTGGGLPTPEQERRMTLSLEFADRPNGQIASDLKAYGVSGYVVNLSLTEHRNWSEFAIERFRSGNFVYLELK